MIKNLFPHQFKQNHFLLKSSQRLSAIGLLLLAPSSIINFFEGRFQLGMVILVVIVLFAINTWLCRHGYYHLSINFFVITPSIILLISLAFREHAVIAAFWSYLAILSFYLILPEKLAWIASTVFFIVIIPQAWVLLEPPLPIRYVTSLIGICAISFIFVRIITAHQKKLEKLAITDPLTGLLNRSQLQNTLENAIQQSHRSNIPMTLIMIDIDDFKSINDSFGHETGDIVLRNFGVFLRKFFRNSDTVFRIGGEEFLVLLFNTDTNNCKNIADNLRNQLAHIPLLPDCPVTISMGGTTLLPDIDWKDWMKCSDNNLYQAKLNGRNQVVI
ncbi:MAG: GGDEF domain-containing protein [Methylococcaceae bacterium]|nr:GGDEF domain-containing protein [Methylococcaceae bacterium]